MAITAWLSKLIQELLESIQRPTSHSAVEFELLDGGLNFEAETHTQIDQKLATRKIQMKSTC